MSPAVSAGRHRYLQPQAVQLALSQPTYNADQLCDLVKLMPRLGEKQNLQVMALIEVWHCRGQPWQAVEKVREALRMTVILNETLPATIRTAAEKWYGETSSDDAVQRNLWLFDSIWRVKLRGVTEGESVRSYQEREKRQLTRRLQAVDEILMSRGTAGVRQLAEMLPHRGTR